MAAEIYISKLKARRGTNEQRLHTRFDQGEFVHTTDTKRLYVGNGVLSGGNPISTKVHPPLTNYYSLSNTIAEIGDLVSVNSIWYQLTATPYSTITNWGDMRTKFSTEFEYDSNSTINITLSGLSASKINPNTVTNGVQISNNKLQLAYNSNFFEISAYKLSIKNGGLTQRELLSTSFGSGISGGNGNLITLTVNPSSFYFDTAGRLNVNMDSLSSIAADKNTILSPITNTYDSLSDLVDANLNDLVSWNGKFYQLTATPPTALSAWGYVGTKLSTNFEYSSANELTLETLGSALTSVEFPKINVDQYGRVTNTESSVYDALTGNSSLNSTNSLSSIFNGTPSHSLSGGIPGLTITKFEAVSSNGVTSQTITLSSAGFLTFEGGFQTRTGKDVGRFAIPIFTY